MSFYDVAPFSPAMVPVEDALTPRELVAKMARELGFDPEEIRGPGRYKRLRRPRKIIAEALMQRDLSLREVGIALGGRHHTSVIWLLRGGRRKR